MNSTSFEPKVMWPLREIDRNYLLLLSELVSGLSHGLTGGTITNVPCCSKLTFDTDINYLVLILRCTGVELSREGKWCDEVKSTTKNCSTSELTLLGSTVRPRNHCLRFKIPHAIYSQF